MTIEFRKLKASEIETRAQSVKQNGAVFLLYKDARCDMNILDETVGATNWQRNHKVVNGNLFCTVSLYDEDKDEWVKKEDVGTESRTEKQKGEASDSFKRACFNWGIGRELYTAPFIWIKLSSNEVYKPNNSKNYRIDSKINFEVSSISYDDEGKISDLEIIDQDGNLRYKMGEYIPAGGRGNNKSSSGKKKKKSSTSTGSENEITQKTAVALKDYIDADNKKAKQIIQNKLKKEGHNGWGGIFELTEEEGQELLDKIA